MGITGKGIIGISLAAAAATCIATDVFVRNTKKFRKLKESDKKESDKKEK